MGRTVFVMVAVLLSAASARVFYVHPDSTQNRIQDCLDSCATGDTVLVGAGTYYENISWPSVQGVKLLSEYGRDTTIIDGGVVDCVVDFPAPVDTTTVMSGFTLTNGYAEFGGGIRCGVDASPLIAANLITLNRAYGTTYGHGGGIGLSFNASPVIRGNTISRNRAEGNHGAGGGIMCAGGSVAVIENNVVEGNRSVAGGGGILCYEYSAVTLRGNSFRYDTSDLGGGGVALQQTHCEVVDNTITGNLAPRGAGLYVGVDDSSLIRRNTIAANEGCGIGAGENNASLIDSCTIADNLGAGIHLDRAGAFLVVRHNDIINNLAEAVRKDSGDVKLDARENWWGDATGPFHPEENPSGRGDTVSDHVTFIPWLDYPMGIADGSRRGVVGQAAPAAIVRGVLRLADSPSSSLSWLLDITGRKVLDLAPGPNDIRHLSPGVYFCRQTAGFAACAGPGTTKQRLGTTTKVLVTR